MGRDDASSPAVVNGVISSLGGIEWGASTDGGRIYVNSSDNGQQGFSGRFTALDAATGKKVWDIADPDGIHFHLGPASVSNGVMLPARWMARCTLSTRPPVRSPGHTRGGILERRTGHWPGAAA